MKGSETKLVAYMQGASKRFVIPVYQRNYDWRTENCKQLYNDLVTVVKSHRKSHFFGSIVSVYNPDGENDEFMVIDGQQRLTTVSLLLLAMYNLLEYKVIVAAKASLSERIYEEYLVDKWQDKETRIKLKPVKNDQKAFARLFDDDAVHIKESNLTINYNYFYERIQKQEVTVDELFDAICRLEIINITLNQDDNPQLIFESLNSTGVALSEGDKIRNFILMGLPTKEQNDFYEKYWNRIEICTDYDVSSFIRDYLSVKQQMIPSQSKVYFTFKAFVEESGFTIEELLKELLFYARLYEVLLKGNIQDKRLNSCIYRLNRLETTITRPFFLEVLRLQNEGKLTVAETSDIFLTIENYLFRRTMCDLPTNALSKIFLLLHREIIRFDGTDAEYPAKFKYALLSKRERARFPDDAEFASALAERQVYLMNSKNKIYLLERFENYGTLEDKDVYRHLDDGDFSVEHIMPQHLTSVWVRELGEDYERIHEVWLHRMANLTLTAYNSKYSNSSFTEKRDMKNGFRESGIRMNAYIAQKDKWTLAELEERSSYLAYRALEIWSAPVTNYKPEAKQLDSYTLDDDVDVSGRQITRFSYKNMEQPVTSWTDMFERVLKILHTEDKSVLSKLVYNADVNRELSAYVSDKETDLRQALEIDDGIYMEKNTSTGVKLSMLRRFFKLYHADPADLIMYLKGDTVVSDEKLAGSRYKLRKRYWSYALEYIRKAHGDNGAFCNVNPSKENWINGFFGIGGFYICCVANYDSARVELYLGKMKKEDNKAAFDKLFLMRTEIEGSLGVPLVWCRGDDIKSSKIYYQLRNVSIENETDWIQMAKFHAQWSKKFYDLVVPYLKEG
ncbi:DUF4268 domain-containing protein [Clostridium sp. MCC353]|uniref:DUF4268 domain-containing protein n=1 Tax=Clostridium sp. MCC353 TaxID=2592646 RepID=UPI001C030929|nr:DUF4268 domain-containing protein [Clostridium sp. MCC353]MBT9775382.1 DUF4268 domain-containing protein [Clostridium sp. MCC353]